MGLLFMQVGMMAISKEDAMNRKPAVITINHCKSTSSTNEVNGNLVR